MPYRFAVYVATTGQEIGRYFTQAGAEASAQRRSTKEQYLEVWRADYMFGARPFYPASPTGKVSQSKAGQGGQIKPRCDAGLDNTSETKSGDYLMRPAIFCGVRRGASDHRCARHTRMPLKVFADLIGGRRREPPLAPSRTRTSAPSVHRGIVVIDPATSQHRSPGCRRGGAKPNQGRLPCHFGWLARRSRASLTRDLSC